VGEGGIAEALSLTEFFANKEKTCVILGDNIIEKNILQAVQSFEKQEKGAKIILKEVIDAHRFGVPVFEDGKVVRIEEKPRLPKSPYAVTGIYFYDVRVFDIIKTLKPSDRGELEITDVNNAYIETGDMTYDILDGWWSDAGTFDSLVHATNLVAMSGANKL
jgi:glucose-1-phosphate thymidylyltransferase